MKTTRLSALGLWLGLTCAAAGPLLAAVKDRLPLPTAANQAPASLPYAGGFVWTPVTLPYLSNGSQSAFGGAIDTTSRLSVNPQGVSESGATVQMPSGSTANAFQVKQGGTTLTKITAAGVINAPSYQVGGVGGYTGTVSDGSAVTGGIHTSGPGTQAANTLLAGPASGAATLPSFRLLAPTDLPVATASTLGGVKIGAGLIVDGAGVVSSPGGQIVIFEASIGSGSGNQANGTLSGSFNTVALPNLITNTGGGTWNTSTYVYTVPITGTYLITTFLRVTDSATAGYNVGLGVNTSNADSAAFAWNVLAAGSGGAVRRTLLYSRVAHFAAGAGLRLFAYYDSSPSITYSDADLAISLLSAG